MKLGDGELEFLNEIRSEVDKVIDKVCKKYGTDRAFYSFVLSCNVYNENLEKLDEILLLDDTPVGFCVFCGKKTYFCENDRYYCLECYSKLVANRSSFEK